MFEKTLSDVVKGIRASKRDTALYISQCIAEIKTEINSTDPYVKANALQKITFLQMMGFSMNWANFASIEVMSSPRFAHKRIGYLAASQGFTQDTDVILLTTNLLKKELRGAVGAGMNGVYEAGLAINFISNIVTEDLARDLLPELTNLTSHPQPYLRKKAVLCLFKLFVKYPQGLRLTFDRVQQCLDDTNPSVVSCAVNVITELSDKNPKNYLHLAPAFFQLLTNSSNNWMLIKVVKLLGSLVAEEPRLARKLLDPLAAIVQNTQAKSLLYEAVHTITLSLPYCRKSDGSMPPSVPNIVTLCARTLRSFVEESDQNLKYLGLVGFGSLIASHPRVLTAPDYRPLILACLSDEDVTIRTRALDLLGRGMASRKNLMELVGQLVRHVELASGEYKNDLVEKIIQMCSRDRYALLQDFGWYLDILIVLGHMRGIETHADLLRSQIVDVALRVLPVRAYAVKRAIEILMEGEGGAVEKITTGSGSDGRCVVADNGRGKHIMPEILPAVAWIVGEYSDLIGEALLEVEEDEDKEWKSYSADSKGIYHSILQALMAPSNTQKLPTTTQSIYVQAAMKVFAAATGDNEVSDQELESCVDTLTRCLPLYMESTDVEVQERAFSSNELLRSLDIVTATFGNSSDLPDLTKVDKDDSSVEDDVEDDDLLKIGPPAGSSEKMKKSSNIARTPTGNTLAAKCRSASNILQYLLKPEPMKPTSTKAQRKKRQTPLSVNVDLDKPVDLSVFAQLLEDERSQRPSGSQISIEAVSFTQQRPMRTHTPDTAHHTNMLPLETPVGGAAGDAANGVSTRPFSSFQSSSETGALAHQNRQQHDPFYLDSAGVSETIDDTQRDQSRFGTIQLLDSEEEGRGAADRKSSKKQQKKDRRRKQKKGGPPQVALGAEDFAVLSLQESSTPKTNRKPSAAAVDYTVYSSDEDEQPSKPRGSAGRGKGAADKEFAGLALVDLTTPLRDDEVMPIREHRVVPERPSNKDRTTADAKKKKKKEAKKRKTRSKRKKEAEISSPPVDGDLLDFGGLSSVVGQPPETSQAPTAAAITEHTNNPISSAFDDLLDLSAPVTMPPSDAALSTDHAVSSRSGFVELTPSPTKPPAVSSSGKIGKQPWMKANIKARNAEGSEVVDWRQISLYSKAYPHRDASGTAAAVKLRVINEMDNLSLNNVTVRLKGYEDIVVGNIDPGSSAETRSKAGPFPYASGDESLEIRGSMFASDSSVPVKLTLPATMQLTPVSGLTHEKVLNELSSGEWSSHSVSLEVESGLAPKKIKPFIISFLHAAEVEGESSDALSGALAAKSEHGSQVRALVKVKTSSVKVDLKCTDGALGKALASNLKKLVL